MLHCGIFRQSSFVMIYITDANDTPAGMTMLGSFGGPGTSPEYRPSNCAVNDS